jgi:orotate phosphoribosyltransferase
MLFGPAYKGIPLVAAVAIAFADAGRVVKYAFDRKETKDHGEGGGIIGAPLEGRVLIVDDVISAGTSVRQCVNLIKAKNAIPSGVAVALDRMERGSGELSAVQEVERQYHMPVVSIATLDDLIAFLQTKREMSPNLAAVSKYREKYGVVHA